MLDLDTADAAALIGLDVFEQFFRELHHRGVIPAVYDGDSRLEFVEISLEVGAGSSVELVLTGTVDAEPLEARVVVEFRLAPAGAPDVMLAYGGVAAVTPEAVSSTVEEATAGLAIALAATTFDVASPLVAALEAPLYGAGAAPPPREDWETTVALLAGAGEHPACVGVFTRRPGRSVTAVIDASLLPALTDFAVVVSRDVMDELLAFAAATAGNGAAAPRLRMGNEAVQLRGTAAGDPLARLGGPVTFVLQRGTYALWADGREVTGAAWKDWAPPLAGGLLAALGPVGLMSDGPWLAPLHGSEPGGGPGAGLPGALAAGLRALRDGLLTETPDGGRVSAASTPDRAVVTDGCLVLAAQVFVEPIEQPIRNGRYDHGLGRIVYLELDSGRGFRPSELARLMDLGKIVVPGHHSVGGRYVRSNPDATEANNLLQLLGVD